LAWFQKLQTRNNLLRAGITLSTKKTYLGSIDTADEVEEEKEDAKEAAQESYVTKSPQRPPSIRVDDVEEKLKATTLSAGDKDYSMDFKWIKTEAKTSDREELERRSAHSYVPR
jgi:hypothetical protein